MFYGDKIALENIANNTMCLLINEGIVNVKDEEGLLVYVSNIPSTNKEKKYINKGEMVRYKILGNMKEFILAKEIHQVICTNPTSVEDLKFFAHFQSMLGKFDKEMKDFLSGIFCHQHIRPDLTIEEMALLSFDSLSFVMSWNDFIITQYASKKGIDIKQAKLDLSRKRRLRNDNKI